MTEILLWLILLTTVISAGINMKLYIRQESKAAEKRQDEACEKAMKENTELESEDAEKSRKMDEFVQNIMAYEVSLGRGKKTGGEP